MLHASLGYDNKHTTFYFVIYLAVLGTMQGFIHALQASIAKPYLTTTIQFQHLLFLWSLGGHMDTGETLSSHFL